MFLLLHPGDRWAMRLWPRALMQEPRSWGETSSSGRRERDRGWVGLRTPPQSLDEFQLGNTGFLTGSARRAFESSPLVILGADTIGGDYLHGYIAFRVALLRQVAATGNLAMLAKLQHRRLTIQGGVAPAPTASEFRRALGAGPTSTRRERRRSSTARWVSSRMSGASCCKRLPHRDHSNCDDDSESGRRSFSVRMPICTARGG